MSVEDGSHIWLGTHVSQNIKHPNFVVMRTVTEVCSIVRNAKVEGEHLPRTGPALLVVGPHTYWSDPAILAWAVMQDAHRTARIISIADFVNQPPIKNQTPNLKSFNKIPLPIRKAATRLIVDTFDPIPIHRGTVDRRFANELNSAIEKKELIGLFIEESDANNDLSKARSGAAHIANMYPDLPIYAVGIINADPRKGLRNLRVSIAPPFTLNQLRREDPNINRQAVSQHIVNVLASTIGIQAPRV